MFYRFLSKLATQERLEAFPVRVPGTARDPYRIPVAEYEDRFEPVEDPEPFSGLTQLRAPCFGTDRVGFRLRFHSGKDRHAELPDIWGVSLCLVVSERAKRVIQSFDPFDHEFIEIGWLDAEEQPIKTEQPFYWFQPRRYLRIEPSAHVATVAEVGFCPIPREEDFLGRVLDDPSLRERIETIPLWRHFGQEGIEGRGSSARMVLYVNSALGEELLNKKLRGFELYSRRFGAGEESVAKI